MVLQNCCHVYLAKINIFTKFVQQFLVLAQHFFPFSHNLTCHISDVINTLIQSLDFLLPHEHLDVILRLHGNVRINNTEFTL
jgi:hypothetical protein